MRSNLTFLGFLRQYVKELSGQNTLSIKKLVYCCDETPKLREPLFLFAVFNNQLDTLCNALSVHPNHALSELCDKYSHTVTVQMLQDQSQALPERVLRVWRSYTSAKNETDTKNYIKNLMREQIVTLLSDKTVSVYRASKDLNLNQGNLSNWLKHGNQSSISYESAERFLDYLNAIPAVQ